MSPEECIQNIDEHLSTEITHIPSLGLVYRKNRSIAFIVKDLLHYEHDQTFLPYDKDARWYPKKQEHIVLNTCTEQDNLLFVPVLKQTDKKTTLVIHILGDGNLTDSMPVITDIRSKTPGEIHRTQLFRFNQPIHTNQPSHSTVYLKTFSADDVHTNPTTVCLFSELEPAIKNTFVYLTEGPDLYGSQMLWHLYLSKGIPLSPIFVAVEEDKIISMIGPLDIIDDPWHEKQFLPPYFEVHPEHRSKGVGRALWNAAMQWAYEHGAKYQIVQSQTGSAADHFYKKLQLPTHGQVFVSTVNE